MAGTVNQELARPPSHIPDASQPPARGFRKPRERPAGTPIGLRDNASCRIELAFLHGVLVM